MVRPERRAFYHAIDILKGVAIAFQRCNHTSMAVADSNLKIPEALMAEVQQRAEVEQRSPEELVQEAVERYLLQKRRERLYARGEEQARKLGIREEDIPGIVKESRQTSPRGR